MIKKRIHTKSSKIHRCKTPGSEIYADENISDKSIGY
jgi:hypothetical protein